MPSFSDCYGCSLCLLSCPMWLQRRDVRFSPQGYAKAMQHGADVADMTEQLSACIQCGACDLLCPEKIDLSAMIATALQKTPLAKTESTCDEAVADYFSMSCEPALLQHLRVDDLYIIEASHFHANHCLRVEHYTELRRSTGCSMNLDLNRMAVSTGIGSRSVDLQSFDVTKQVQWMIQGRSFERIIVENMADKTMLAEITGKPVLHVSELIG